MKHWRKSAAALVIVVLCLILIVSTGPGTSSAEPATPQSIQEPSPVVMIALPWDDPSIRIPPPQQFRAELAPTATFSINYLSVGMPDGQGATCLAWNSAAQTAFSYAASVWATMMTSSVPIRINACWADLGSPTTLGYSWSNMARNFTGAPQSSTWYNYSLADALAGVDLDPAKPDTYITYNNGFAWYFGTAGLTPGGQYDFVSVVMHEMGHGLNFSGTMGYGSSRCGSASYGCWGLGTGYPGIYDRFTENGAGQALLTSFASPSAALGTQLTSDNLYFDGPNANAANGGSRVKIYAPSTWAPGSSYAHLDYSTFSSTPNRLMVYAIPAASSIHDPGSVSMGLLKDLGWNPTTNNPVPAITGLDPSSATPGGPAFTLTVNGTGFVSSSVVRWNGSPRTTTYVNGTKLTAAITAADIAVASTASVTVFNPAPGGGTSNARSFSVTGQEKVYLPLVLNGFQPILAAPVLNAIDNADGDGNYTVSWNASANATSYLLQEDDSAAFSSPETRYSGSGTSWNATGKAVGTYYYRVQAANAYGSSSWSETRSVIVSATSDIVNGGFEGGNVGWTEYSTHGWPIIVNAFTGSVTPHSGTWAAWLGGEIDDISYVQQQVTVPPSRPYLAYWHWIASNDACGYDFGGVIINSTVVDVYNLCTSANTGGWIKHVVNLSAYAGQSVSIQIHCETDSSANSNLFVDDVAFQSSASSPTGIDAPDHDPTVIGTKAELGSLSEGAANPVEPLRMLGGAQVK